MKKKRAGLPLGGLLVCVSLAGLMILGWRALGAVLAQKPTADPLPHSMKGYELYSWPVAGKTAWRYALLTGTNRLKTADEILSARDELTDSGMVMLSAQGTEALKSVLGGLPKGEVVNWIGPGWLATVGGAQGPFALPGPEVRAEVEEVCRARGVELWVTE
jgi:hypothetical protein